MPSSDPIDTIDALVRAILADDEHAQDAASARYVAEAMAGWWHRVDGLCVQSVVLAAVDDRGAVHLAYAGERSGLTYATETVRRCLDAEEDLRQGRSRDRT